MLPNPTLIVITGPTAVGKTAIAIELARYFKTEIISADSRQIYKELKIGTAVPTPEQLLEIHHHFIGCRSIQEYYSAYMFETEVLDSLKNLFATYPVVIMVGGSGMYINAVCNGIDDLPTIDPELRKDLLIKFEQNGIEYLWHQLKLLDPEYYKVVDLKNPKRILKALEVSLMMGRPYSSLLTGNKKKREFSIIKTGIRCDRETLYTRINNRVNEMMEAGLVNEVSGLQEYKNVNALNTVGYKEIFAFLDKKCTLPEAIELIKRNTRRYAKRQLTWFQHDPEITWFESQAAPQMINFINQKLNSGC